MMNIKLIIIAIIPFVLVFGISAQSSKDNVIREIVEDLAETDVELESIDQIFEELQFLLENPLNINDATRFDLEKLIFLSENQISEIIDYVKINGGFTSIYQLQLLNSFTVTELKRLINFITVEKKDQKNKKKYLNGEFLIRDVVDVETASGFKKDGGYLGDKNHLASRFRMRYGNSIQFGGIVEKDPGEEFLRKPKYTDFASAYFMYEGKGIVKRAIVGDYKVEIGEGLGMNTGFGIRKSSIATQISNRSNGVNKYSSSSEFGFLRGAAIRLGYKKFAVDVFTSYKKIDGEVVLDTVNDNRIATSFLRTGYHRTSNELEKKNTIGQFVTGTNLNIWLNKFQVYGGGCFQQKDIDSIANERSYRDGSWIKNSGANYWLGYKVNLTKGLLFGEVAGSSSESMAFIQGIKYNPANNFNMSLFYRHFSNKWHAEFSNPLSEFTDPLGERGLYIGFNAYPLKNVEVNGYLDAFENNRIKFGIDQPSDGYDGLLKISYQPKSSFQTYILYRSKEKASNTNEDEHPINSIKKSSINRLRWHSAFDLSEKWELQTRLEKSFYKQGEFKNSQGELMYMDLKYTSLNSKMVISFRYLVFNIEDFDARIYAYERDLLYSFYVPSYNGKGTRIYLNSSYKFSNNLSCWLKIGRTIFDDKKEIGSGLQTIEGNTRTNFKIQLRYKF